MCSEVEALSCMLVSAFVLLFVPEHILLAHYMALKCIEEICSAYSRCISLWKTLPHCVFLPHCTFLLSPFQKKRQARRWGHLNPIAITSLDALAALFSYKCMWCSWKRAICCHSNIWCVGVSAEQSKVVRLDKIADTHISHQTEREGAAFWN